MASGSNRRGFFKELLKGAAEVAQEVGSAMRGEGGAPADEADAWQVAPPLRAQPVGRTARERTLVALCLELGLERRTRDVRRLARPSIRLTRAAGEDAVGASR